MTILYRSPTMVVDDHEWHIAVTIAHPRGRPIKQYLWRPLSAKRFMWSPITEWIGPKPKRLAHRMRKYDRHAVVAMDVERVRLERVQELGRKRPNGAALRNPGAERVAA